MAPTVITLTTIPSRFALLGPTLDSLVRQDLPAPVELWIPRQYRRFPRWDGLLPAVPPGVSLRRCDTDWGPATKIIPAVLERAGQDTDLLFCDDDSLYAPDFHRRFKDLRQQRPDAALAALGRHLKMLGLPESTRAPRMRRLPHDQVAPLLAGPQAHSIPVPLVAQSGYADLLGGWCGVMVRPSFFHPALAEGPGRWWPVDDVWLSALLEAAGTPIWVEGAILPPIRRQAGGRDALTLMTHDGLDRAGLDRGCAQDMAQRLAIWQG